MEAALDAGAFPPLDARMTLLLTGVTIVLGLATIVLVLVGA